MQHLVLASGNRGKLNELRDLLAALPLQLQAQSEYSVTEAEETGLSFAENALLKARHAAQHTGLAALADDSGLAVDALMGAPGIYSARYAGSDATDSLNRAKLLTALERVSAEQRTAYFHCVLVLMRHAKDPVPLICHGAWRGQIAFEERGEHGFGYDSIFIPSDMEITAAELDPSQKQRISHRALAMQQLREALRNYYD